MDDVVVVGGGLFGAIAAAALRRRGATVTVVSDDREGSSSPAAGCVMRPSWMSNMTRPQMDEAFALLDELYGLKTIKFTVLPLRKTVECYRVEPSVVLNTLAGPGTATHVEDDGIVIMSSGAVIEARAVIVAAGIWTRELCPWVPALTGKWGWSHRGPPIGRAVISPWAPYRQVVAFDMDDGRSWAGDGTALIERSVNTLTAHKSLERCLKVTGHNAANTFTILGARPYCATDGAPCHISRQGRVWAVTGGAKNGTAAAAWAARQILRELRL